MLGTMIGDKKMTTHSSFALAIKLHTHYHIRLHSSPHICNYTYDSTPDNLLNPINPMPKLVQLLPINGNWAAYIYSDGRIIIDSIDVWKSTEPTTYNFEYTFPRKYLHHKARIYYASTSAKEVILTRLGGRDERP